MPYLDLSKLTLFRGDAAHHLKGIKSESVDLVFTSPPYAEQREGDYASIPEEKYVDWFLPIGSEIRRILKPTGSFMLNIKAHCDKGERSLYVMELVIALRNKVGFKFIDEYVWYKSASPRRKTFRLKNAWEPVFHFGSSDKPFINHEAIRIKSESTFGEKRGYTTYNDLTGNVGGYHDICRQIEGWTDPDNILYYPTSLLVKDKFPHPAKFPLELASFLVKGFSPEGGVVLDPFGGSGMVPLAAILLNRSALAIEIEPRFADMIVERLTNYNPDETIQGLPPKIEPPLISFD